MCNSLNIDARIYCGGHCTMVTNVRKVPIFMRQFKLEAIGIAVVNKLETHFPLTEKLKPLNLHAVKIFNIPISISDLVVNRLKTQAPKFQSKLSTSCKWNLIKKSTH